MPFYNISHEVTNHIVLNLILGYQICIRNQYIDSQIEEEITPFVDDDQQDTQNLVKIGKDVNSTY